jgi:hypothetical protein
VVVAVGGWIATHLFPPSLVGLGVVTFAGLVAPVFEPQETDMQYQLAPLYCRPWTLNGITPRLIESHYETNYGDALRRLNAVTHELETADPAQTPVETINRLKRDEASLLNSTLLHELYFASLGGDGRAVPPALAEALPATSARSIAGGGSSWRSPRRWPAARAGSC